MHNSSDSWYVSGNCYICDSHFSNAHWPLTKWFWVIFCLPIEIFQRIDFKNRVDGCVCVCVCVGVIVIWWQNFTTFTSLKMRNKHFHLRTVAYHIDNEIESSNKATCVIYLWNWTESKRSVKHKKTHACVQIDFERKQASNTRNRTKKTLNSNA